MKGFEPTVQYLQRLGPDHSELIFECAEWVLEKAPEEGIKVF